MLVQDESRGMRSAFRKTNDKNKLAGLKYLLS